MTFTSWEEKGKTLERDTVNRLKNKYFLKFKTKNNFMYKGPETTKRTTGFLN